MTKKLKLFFKSLSLSNILFNILVLFLVGIFSRFLINNLFDYTLLIELFSFLSLSLYISQFSFFDSIDSKFFEDNINSFKRPRDRVINSNDNINKDPSLVHEFKDKFRRKCHWVFLEQFSSEFKDFKDFKSCWDPNKKYTNLLKDQYYDKKGRIKLFKKTLSWFLNHRNN